MTNWSVFQSPHIVPAGTAMRMQAGVRSRLTVNIMGSSTGAPPPGQTFNHPWRPFLSGGSVTFNLATIASFAGDGPIEPTIRSGGEQVRMSGKPGGAPTPLALASNVANADGVSWAVLEVHPDATTGELKKDSLIEIVHSGVATVSHTLTLGRCPIALILWSQGHPLRVEPIVHYNLRYLRQVPTDGGGAPRHLFL